MSTDGPRRCHEGWLADRIGSSLAFRNVNFTGLGVPER
jgi:hypothetical protein